MSGSKTYPVEGGCPCRTIRYRVEREPLVVHCCFCTYCQKETGTSFGMNAMLESNNVSLLGEVQPVPVPTPSESGQDQVMHRCPKCSAIVWSEYSGSNVLKFVRVGTLDDPSVAPPTVQIYTRSKQPWNRLNEDIPSREVYYDKLEIWSQASLDRLESLQKSSQGSG